MTLLKRRVMATNRLVTVTLTIHGLFKMVKSVVNVEGKLRNKGWVKYLFLFHYFNIISLGFLIV